MIVGILIILTISIHYKEFLEYPLEQIKNLSSSGGYGFGSFHPIVFTLLIYVLLWIPRSIMKLFNKKSKKT